MQLESAEVDSAYMYLSAHSSDSCWSGTPCYASPVFMHYSTTVPAGANEDVPFYFVQSGGQTDTEEGPQYINRLHKNAPNPFNANTEIRYSLENDTKVTMRIYDLLGREVMVLLYDEPNVAGEHLVTWNGVDDKYRKVASGVYFYRITAGAYSETRRMLLVK